MLKVANTIADIAAKISRFYFRKELPISLKKGSSPVTEADLAIESAIREYLSRELPSHGILGEEYDLKLGDSEYTWVIDPIDGTASFACGKPTFCTLISLLQNGMPIIGIIDQPITKERWCGILGEQSTLNNVPCFSHSASEAGPIRLSCTTSAMFTSEQIQKFESVKNNLASVVSYGGDGYAYGLLASGFVDIILEADLKFYDVAALIPIIEGAGGRVMDWHGNQIKINTFNGTMLATCNKKLQEKVLDIIN